MSMDPFALSVPGYRLGVHGRKRARKQQHQQQQDTSQSPSPEPEEAVTATSSRLPSDSINPLSHTPGTLRQLALAGLSPKDELPSKLHPTFPHKPLPAKRTRTRTGRGRRRQADVMSATESGAESDSTVTSATQRTGGERGGDAGKQEHSARIRHLNTMTAIMHRCLRDGDIPRAKRAFSLLVQTKDVDVRLDHLWAIGSEILMRDPTHDRFPSPHIKLEETEDEYDDNNDDGEEGRQSEQRKPPTRWGTAANVEQVKTYFETLIQQHPHDVHRPHLTSAWDFWPALFGIEIYNLDAEFQAAQHRIRANFDFALDPSDQGSNSSGSEHDKMDIDGGSDSDHAARRDGDDNDDEEEEEKAERHRAIDALRADTQRGALEIASRMDGVLENPPYSTRHAELLRLRGHVALFVGDLYLPSRLVDRYSAAVTRRRREGSITDSMRGLSLLRGGSSSSSSDLLRAKRGRPDEQVALGRRRTEQDRAREFFRRALSAGAELEEWILNFLEPEEDGDEDSREEL